MNVEAPLFVEVIHPPGQTRPDSTKGEPLPPGPARPPVRKKKEVAAAPAPAAPVAPPEQAPPTDAPLVEKVPPSDAPLADAPARERPLVLTPSADALAEKLPEVEPEAPRGRTLRPGDPSLAPEALAAEERARVGARVDGWLQDGASDARTRGGLPHPYFVEMRDALQAELRHSDGGTPEALGVREGLSGLVQSYSKAAEQYAQTGNPGLPPPGRAPQQSEVLQERFKDESAALQMRALVQGQETLAALEHRAPLFALKLELKQARDGVLLDARVVESSGSKLFDDFVLTSGAEALSHLPPPPEDAYRTDSRRSLWQVEGWLHQPQETKTAAALGMLPSFMGIPAGDLLAKLDSRNLRFEFRARLLRSY